MTTLRSVTMCFAAVSALWVSSVAGAHDKECSSPRLVGTWMLAVTPEPNPEVPVVPPAFTALFQFETAGTISETDGGFHPTSTVDLFPDLGSLSSSDGIGAWEAERGDRYRGQFIKNLFDATGKHIGFVVTRISITLLDADRLEATSTSDFVLGADWTAEPFFAGGVTRATGTRVRAH